MCIRDSPDEESVSHVPGQMTDTSSPWMQLCSPMVAASSLSKHSCSIEWLLGEHSVSSRKMGPVPSPKYAPPSATAPGKEHVAVYKHIPFTGLRTAMGVGGCTFSREAKLSTDDSCIFYSKRVITDCSPASIKADLYPPRVRASSVDKTYFVVSADASVSVACSL